MKRVSKCPACGREGTLYVVRGVFSLVGTGLKADGTYDFLLDRCSLSNEVVQCKNCSATFMLQELLSHPEPHLLGDTLKLNTSGADFTAVVRPIGLWVSLAFNGINLKKLIGKEALKRLVAQVLDLI